jgi:hypothetical protein
MCMCVNTISICFGAHVREYVCIYVCMFAQMYMRACILFAYVHVSTQHPCSCVHVCMRKIVGNISHMSTRTFHENTLSLHKHSRRYPSTHDPPLCKHEHNLCNHAYMRMYVYIDLENVVVHDFQYFVIRNVHVRVVEQKIF